MKARAVLLPGVLLASAGAAYAGNANNLMFPFNVGVWNPVPFSANGAQGNGPAAPGDPLQRNDDDFAQAGTGMPGVPFNFNLYGTNFSGGNVFINNNGNLSFGSGFSTFTASGFPVAGFPMVAPFWADVDTRDANSGAVYYQYLDGNSNGSVDTLVVTWDNVGYYNTHSDHTNTFQVAISDGTNPAMGLGNNVCFSYDTMGWTTGDASGGAGGFGGTPSTVGVNAGNGSDFFQFGRFDHPGADYDGPGGNNDGVNFLDHRSFCFSVTGLQNQAPIAVGLPANNKYFVDINGPALDATFNLIGPEIGDGVTIDSILDLDGAQANGLVIVSADGDPASVHLLWAPAGPLNGTNWHFVVNFHDSFGLSNSVTFQICVVPAPAALGLLTIGASTLIRRRR